MNDNLNDQNEMFEELEELKGMMVDLYEILKHQSHVIKSQHEVITHHIGITKELISNYSASMEGEMSDLDRLVQALEDHNKERLIFLH